MIYNKRGNTLVFTIIVFAVVMIMGTGLLMKATVSQNMSEGQINKQQAYYTAKSAIDTLKTALESNDPRLIEQLNFVYDTGQVIETNETEFTDPSSKYKVKITRGKGNSLIIETVGIQQGVTVEEVKVNAIINKVATGNGGGLMIDKIPEQIQGAPNEGHPNSIMEWYAGRVENDISSDKGVGINNGINGSITSGGEVIVSGDMYGNVKAEGKVSINNGIRGNVISGQRANISGFIRGTVEAAKGVIINDGIEGGIVSGNDAQVSGFMNGNIKAYRDVTINNGIKGDIISGGNVIVSNEITGDIYAKGNVTINNGMKGNIIAGGDVTISGTISGNIYTKGNVTINNSITGSVEGNREPGICAGGKVTIHNTNRVNVCSGTEITINNLLDGLVCGELTNKWNQDKINVCEDYQIERQHHHEWCYGEEGEEKFIFERYE